MKHTDQRVPLLRCKLGLLWIASLVASCTGHMAGSPDAVSTDAAVAAVDPTGNWNVEYAYGAACDRPPLIEASTLTVTRGPAGYVVAAAGVTATATLICTPQDCRLSGTFAWSQATAHFQQDVSLVLDARDGITGTGTELVVDAGMCSYTFTVGGMKI